MTFYLNTAVHPPKYWEARLDGVTLDLHEGALGTLGKGTHLTLGDLNAAAKELAKRTKAKIARGFVARPDDAPTLDALLSRYAPHEVEASHGDPARALAKALAAMPPKGDAYPRDLARSAIALASRGAACESRALRDALAAAADGTTGADGASRRATLAAVDLALGDREAARAWLDAALAMSDAWRDGRRWHSGYSQEGVLGAETLLALGRDDEARELFTALGYHALAPLLAKRRLDWFDALAPSVQLTGFMRELFQLRRAGVEREGAFVEALVTLATQPLAPSFSPLDRLRAISVAFSEHDAPVLSAAGVVAVCEALRGAVARWSTGCEALRSAPEPWYVAATIATLGGDVADDLARAVTLADRARAVGVIARTTRDPRAREAAAELARGFEGAVAAVPGAELVDALAGAVDLGVTVSVEALVAAAARVDHYALGTLAATSFRQCTRGDDAAARRDFRTIGWHLLGLAPKTALATSAQVARIGLAVVGDFEAYEIVSDRIPPVGYFHCHDECALLAKHRR